ncbi:MAG: hypothetical protein JJU05_05780 [Verrucomicrobia bacterium]|nr:hypothetical protein [Verrucomicrobiota bacterium]MCH8525649.1 hypothetical protein [Kiritimatiellia bacterium]
MISEPIRTEKIVTDDGSLTCRHPLFGEPYHALQGARSEAESKFIRPSRLAARLTTGSVRLLDVGFGLGVNCRAAVGIAHAASAMSESRCDGDLLRCCDGIPITASPKTPSPPPPGLTPSNPDSRRRRCFPLTLDTLEADPDAWLRARELYPDCAVTRALAETGRFEDRHCRITRYDGDLRRSLPDLTEPYDLIFHDPFSPLKNTECWTLDVFRLLFARLKPDGLLLTYSESAAVRAGLLQAGSHIGATPAVPPHRGGTMASPDPAALPHPVDPVPFRIYPKNIPFRDPALTDTGHAIRARREAEVRDGRFALNRI